MNKEKFRFIQQKRSILRSLNKQEHSDITQAGIGDDYSRLVLLDSELAVTEGLCLANALGTVTSDVIKQYNKLRLGGYQPFALTDTVMMPENDEKRMKKILRELSDLAKQGSEDAGLSTHNDIHIRLDLCIFLALRYPSSIHRYSYRRLLEYPADCGISIHNIHVKLLRKIRKLPQNLFHTLLIIFRHPRNPASGQGKKRRASDQIF